MPKNKTLSLPFEPIADVPEEEPRSVRLKRYFWLLGAAVVAIVILVLGLFKNNPPPTSPETVSEGANSPDAIIEKFHLVSTVEGRKRWEFYSDVARLYQNRKEAYSDNVYAQYYKKDKLISTLTADSAI